jgi:hypothetical protein
MISKIFVVGLVLSLLGAAASAQTCGGLPYNLTNGQTADATQVMADFSYILNCVAASPVGTARKLTAQQTGSDTMTLSADEIVVETQLGGTAYRVPNVSVTLNVSTTGPNGMDVQPPPTSGDLSVYLIYNPSTEATALLATSGTTSNGSVYSGGHMPSGYAASALVSSLKTTNGAALGPFLQTDRVVTIIGVPVVIGGTATSPTAVALGSVVPANARRVNGTLTVSGGSMGGTINVGSNSTNIGIQWTGVLGINGGIGTGIIAALPLMPSAPQTIYYSLYNATSGNIGITGYEF